MADPHAGVRRHAVRLAETHLAEAPQLGEAILAAGRRHRPAGAIATGLYAGRSGMIRGPARRWANLALALSRRPFHHRGRAQLGHAARICTRSWPRCSTSNRRQEPPAELLEQLVGWPALSTTIARWATALARDRQGQRGQVRRLAVDGPGRLARCARSPQYLVGKIRHVERAGQDVRVCPRDGGRRTRRPRTSGCGRCGCWAVARASRDDDIASLVALLVPQSSGALQTAAVEALARHRQRPGAHGAAGRLEEPRAGAAHRDSRRAVEPRALDRRCCWPRSKTSKCPPATSTPRGGSDCCDSTTTTIKTLAARLLSGRDRIEPAAGLGAAQRRADA